MEQINPADEPGNLQNDLNTEPLDKNFKPKGAIAFFYSPGPPGPGHLVWNLFLNA